MHGACNLTPFEIAVFFASLRSLNFASVSPFFVLSSTHLQRHCSDKHHRFQHHTRASVPGQDDLPEGRRLWHDWQVRRLSSPGGSAEDSAGGQLPRLAHAAGALQDGHCQVAISLLVELLCLGLGFCFKRIHTEELKTA